MHKLRWEGKKKKTSEAKKNSNLSLWSPLVTFFGTIEFISWIIFWWYWWCHNQSLNVLSMYFLIVILAIYFFFVFEILHFLIVIWMKYFPITTCIKLCYFVKFSQTLLFCYLKEKYANCFFFLNHFSTLFFFLSKLQAPPSHILFW